MKDDKISECCNARLAYYDAMWMDGICSKCNEHSASINNERNKEGELIE